MHVIVTRPEADAARLTEPLIAMGHTVSLAPLLQPDSSVHSISFAGAQAIIATSRNALRALAESPNLQAAAALPLIVAGPSSAELARSIGFTTVHSGERGASDLVALIGGRFEAERGPLVYLSGDVMAFDLPAALREHGFTVRREITYTMAEAQSLPDTVVAEIRSGAAGGVILMSPRTAKLFIRLAKRAGVGEAAGCMVYFCLSQAVAESLDFDASQQIYVAARPALEEILALVGELASNHH